MGYGFGVFLLAVGLILAFAVQDMISAVDLTMVGYILALAGVLVIVLTAVQMNSRRRTVTRAVATDAQGRQSSTERHTESDPPPAI